MERELLGRELRRSRGWEAAACHTHGDLEFFRIKGFNGPHGTGCREVCGQVLVCGLPSAEEGGQDGHVQNPSAPPGTCSKHPDLWVTMGWKVRVWPTVWTPSL